MSFLCSQRNRQRGPGTCWVCKGQGWSRILSGILKPIPPPLVSNDPSLQRAYELAKAKERVNIANNANAQRSAGITAWNQEEAQRNYRNRVRGAENQQSARKAELLAEAQENMIDAGTLQSVTNSLMGGIRDLRKEDLFATADKNAQVAKDAQTYASDRM